jgi:hypothetical protein
MPVAKQMIEAESPYAADLGEVIQLARSLATSEIRRNRVLRKQERRRTRAKEMSA